MFPSVSAGLGKVSCQVAKREICWVDKSETREIRSLVLIQIVAISLVRWEGSQLFKKCVCRVCVMPEFYAFYAFHALIESVSYGFMEGLKVQVPPPALDDRLIETFALTRGFQFDLGCLMVGG